MVNEYQHFLFAFSLTWNFLSHPYSRLLTVTCTSAFPLPLLLLGLLSLLSLFIICYPSLPLPFSFISHPSNLYHSRIPPYFFFLFSFLSVSPISPKFSFPFPSYLVYFPLLSVFPHLSLFSCFSSLVFPFPLRFPFLSVFLSFPLLSISPLLSLLSFPFPSHFPCSNRHQNVKYDSPPCLEPPTLILQQLLSTPPAHRGVFIMCIPLDLGVH